MSLRVNVGAVQDIAGNGNAVSGSHTFTVDTDRTECFPEWDIFTYGGVRANTENRHLMRRLRVGLDA